MMSAEILALYSALNSTKYIDKSSERENYIECNVFSFDSNDSLLYECQNCGTFIRKSFLDSNSITHCFNCGAELV